MIKLEIINRDDYIYTLKDDKNMEYNINLEFFDIKENPQIGDYIYISAELINPQYVNDYTFGKIESKYGKENIELTDIDVIKIETNGKEIYLKRLYG